MKTRTAATSSLLTYEPINPETYLDHIPDIAYALDLNPEKLQALFDGTSLAEFNQLLEDSYQESIQSVDKTLDDALTPDAAEEPEMQLYYDHKRIYLNDLRNQLANHLRSRQLTLSEQEHAATDLVIEKIRGSCDCDFGNYERKLNVLKSNIAIALQQAASSLASSSHISKSPDAFNAVFADIARMNRHGKIKLGRNTQELFIGYDLKTLQQKIHTVLAHASQHADPAVKQQLHHALTALAKDRSAALKDGHLLLDVHDGIFAFTSVATEVEQLADNASRTANDLLNTLGKNRFACVESLETDAGKLDRNHQIRIAIKMALDGRIAFRNIISQVKQLDHGIDQDRNEIKNLLSRLEELNALEPNSNRQITETMLADLHFSAEMKQRILDGLQEVSFNLHQEFLGRLGLDFKVEHYHHLSDQLRVMKLELSKVLKDAAQEIPPLNKFSTHCHEIEKRRSTLKLSIVELYEFVANMEVMYKSMESSYNLAREELITLLTNTQKNDWQEDLLQRIDATLLTIDDLSKKYSHHHVFKHTSLRSVITDVLEQSRQATLATRETIEPTLAVIAPQSPKKLSFMQRHPAARKILFSLLIGVSAAMLATIVAGAVIFTVGLALPVAAVAGILVGSAVATGIAGTAVGAKLFDKLGMSDCPPTTGAAKSSISSTGHAIRTLSNSNVIALDSKRSKTQPCSERVEEQQVREVVEERREEQVEVTVDYSTTVTVSSGSPEFSRGHQNRS